MICPDCGTQVADTAKSCPKCGLYLVKEKGQSGSKRVAIVLIVVLLVVLLGGGGYAIWSQLPEEVDQPQGFNPEGKAWVPMSITPYGISMDVPGNGWDLLYDALSQVVFEDELDATLDINVLGPMALNLDAERIDNKPQVFRVLSQDTVVVNGVGEVQYTVAQCREAGAVFNKHQLYFRHSIMTPNLLPQTFTYFVTFSFRNGMDFRYEPLFQHIIESIELTDYS